MKLHFPQFSKTRNASSRSPGRMYCLFPAAEEKEVVSRDLQDPTTSQPQPTSLYNETVINNTRSRTALLHPPAGMLLSDRVLF